MQSPIFASDISTRRTIVLERGEYPTEQIEALRRRIQAGIPVILEDAWKYSMQDNAMERRRR